MQYVDVIVVGAGLSGIGMACHIKRECPQKSIAIIEGRSSIGGTWDLFRYPGIRSDSDMYTLGYQFKPWVKDTTIAEGEQIRNYITEAAHENDVYKCIQFGTKAVSANFDRSAAEWTVVLQEGGQTRSLRAQFLISCCGYYKYEHGYTPDFPGFADYKGEFIHPQLWPKNFDNSNKKIVVIGSGATAVTLIPNLVKGAASVTLLQRSPTYMAAIPNFDPLIPAMRKVMPESMVYKIVRGRNVAIGTLFYELCRKRPETMRRFLIGQAMRATGNKVDVKHFTPKYNPWDERLCALPNGDLFKTLRKGEATIVTDHIDTFTKNGIRLKSGEHLDADVVISATGLELQMLGGADITVDAASLEWSNALSYKGVMVSGMPNAVNIFGYTNASWTLKADLISAYVCRIIKHMDAVGMRQFEPVNNDPTVVPEPFVDLQSGYIQRSIDKFPRQGNKHPWKVHQNYLKDIKLFKYAKLEDGVLQFSHPKRVTQVNTPSFSVKKVLGL